MSGRTTYEHPRDPIESHSFRELFDRYPDVGGPGRAHIFDGSSSRAQIACWAGVRDYANGLIEQELEIERRMEEPYCAVCRDRTVAHEVGDCPTRHQPSQRSVAATSTTAGTVALSSTDPLKRALPIEYVEAFTGEIVPASGFIHCPLHEERTPSFRVYEDHWHCFGCNKTGGVYELASRLTGLSTRGPEFKKLRRWVARRLLDWRRTPHA